VSFALPGSEKVVVVMGEAAWQNPGGQIGIRFTNLEVDSAHDLRVWLNQNCPDSEKDDPPVRCNLTDLSLGGCYLDIASPFPAGTRIVLSMRVSEMELRVEGAVRVMHPDVGMGVEFKQKTIEQRSHVEKFIKPWRTRGTFCRNYWWNPRGLKASPQPPRGARSRPLRLRIRCWICSSKKASLPAELFLNELRKQRRSHQPDATEENDPAGLTFRAGARAGESNSHVPRGNSRL